MELLTNIVNGRDIPEEWCDGRVVCRVFMQVLKVRISVWAETTRCLTELQNGFHRGRRLEDNLFMLTSCIDIARKEGRKLICYFLDVEKAYNNVPHATLFDHLGTLGLAPPLLDTIYG